jgi:hypothetical protein
MKVYPSEELMPWRLRAIALWLAGAGLIARLGVLTLPRQPGLAQGPTCPTG